VQKSLWILRGIMKFKDWIVSKVKNEMASFSLRKDQFTIPCRFLTMRKLPCKEEDVYALDMRFEDPEAYSSPYNHLHQHSFFAALVPGTKNYLVYHGGEHPADVMPEGLALNAGYLPVDNNGIDRSNGAMSSKGYYLVPNDWFVHALLMNKDYEEIKPALADFTGLRAAHLS